MSELLATGECKYRQLVEVDTKRPVTLNDPDGTVNAIKYPVCAVRLFNHLVTNASGKPVGIEDLVDYPVLCTMPSAVQNRCNIAMEELARESLNNQSS